MASPSTARVERQGYGLFGSIRIGARVAALLTILLVLLPVHFLCRLLPLPVWIPRHFLGAVAWIAGARVRKFGEPLRRDVVFIANHVSWVDIVALAGGDGQRIHIQIGVARCTGGRLAIDAQPHLVCGA